MSCSSLSAGGYYYIATVLYLQQKVGAALSMCDKVVEIWYKTVSALRKGEPDVEQLGDAQVMDGLQVLSKIISLREESLGRDHGSVGEACHTLGLLHLCASDAARASMPLCQERIPMHVVFTMQSPETM